MTGASLPAVGDVIVGRYVVGPMLGKGGMGAVFRATQRGLERQVALKVLLPDRTGNRARERFEREAKVSAAMHHDGIVDVYDFGVDEAERLFIVMELLVGESLGARLKREDVVQWKEAAAIVAYVADALASAHAQGLVHRDIKPDNIFLAVVGDTTRVKVVDFGLAFIKDGGELGRLTSDAIISGTPDYMAPEQCRGGTEVTSAADVYALGCVLTELLTAQPPFQGQQGEVLAQQLHVPAPRMATRRPDLPAELSLLLERMLEKKPAARPTATDVAAALRALTQEVQPKDEARTDRLGRAIAPFAGVTSAEAPTTEVATTDIVLERPEVIARGAPTADLAVGLAVNGYNVVELADVETDDAGRGVELLIGASAAQVVRRVKAGATVIAGADPDDIDGLAALVRAGAAEVVSVPIDLAEVLAKVVRAHKRHQRKKR